MTCLSTRSRKGKYTVNRFQILLMGAMAVGCVKQVDVESTANQEKKLSVNSMFDMSIPQPKADKKPLELKKHGDTRVDPYYWLRDDDRADKDILAHLEAENAYTAKVLSGTNGLQGEIFQELNNRIKKDDSTVPVKNRGYYYYQRYEGDGEYAIYARKPGTLDAKEEVLLNGNAMAKDKDYFAIGSYAVSTNNQILAYSTDLIGRRVYTIEFKDLEGKKTYSDKLEGTTGQAVLANDNQTVYYIKKDPKTLLGYKLYRHKIGTSQSDDALVYEELDRSFYTALGKTKDDAMVVIYHSSTTKKGASILDANKPTDTFKPMLALEDNHEYSFKKLGDWFYIRTNWEAKNFRLMKAPIAKAADKKSWQVVIPHDPNSYLNGFEVFRNYLVVADKKNGNNRIRSFELKSMNESTLKFDDPVFLAGFRGNLETDTDTVRLFYTSLTTPMSTYDYNLKTGERSLLKQTEVLGGFQPSNYASERIFVKARDGKDVPVSIVYRKDQFKKDGSNPIYQYGYGSYGNTIEPYFSASRLSLLDRGFVFAIAHIRGGQMLGRPWYEDGKMFNKINTFTDFIDVTKGLVKQNYGAADKVFAAGGSAGGLLIGAVVNMEPSLYKGVAAHVPFVDVVTTMLDESIPLTTNEYDEWGNPNNKDSYEYMLSYSPYDQVKAQDYPHMLVTTGLHDSQVQYFEPAKWVAKLRDMKTGNNVLAFQINMEAGHGGSSGRFRRNKERALEYAFFSYLAGIKQSGEISEKVMKQNKG